MINANKFGLKDIMRFNMNRKERYMLKKENMKKKEDICLKRK